MGDVDAEDHRTLQEFAYLFKGYKSRFYYWEFVISSRKLLVLIISVAFVGGYYITLQSSLLPFTMVVFMVAAHVQCQPFQDDRLNLIELLSLFLTSCLFISGQMLYDKNVGDGGKVFVTALIVISVVLFYVGLIVLYIKEW